MTIPDLLRARGHELQRASAGRMRLRCPLHNENTASAYVSTHRGKERLHCFGCGFHGDGYDLLVALGESPAAAMKILDGGTVGSHLSVSRRRETTSREYNLACARPGCTSTVELRDRTYRTVGREGLEYDVRAVADLAPERLGWEVAPDLIAAVCPSCLERTA